MSGPFFTVFFFSRQIHRLCDLHLTELLLLDEGVDLGIGLLEGLEGLGEDGILSC